MSADGPRAMEVSNRYRARSRKLAIARNLTVLLVLLTGCGGKPAAGRPYEVPGGPNVVFVLTDDLTGDLLRFMPNVQRLQDDGTTFDNYIVSSSLCCPSRATILTGDVPHNTGVQTNIIPHGGLFAYRTHGNPARSWAKRLKQHGFRTGLFGKYLNGYPADKPGIPRGWTDWAGTNKGYFGFDYTLNVDGKPTHFGHRPADYLTDVIAARGERVIDRAATEGRPFVLELAPFTPHRPAVPAPRHRDAFPYLSAPRAASFNRAVADAPPWLAGRPERNAATIARIDAQYRKRARSVLSIDEMLGRLVDRLRATGQLDNTYVVFTSDNGYHMGEHRMLPGKLTAFETDIKVPLIVSGPGVPAGRHVSALVQNSDFGPTFEDLAGLKPRPEVDGRSLLPLMHGRPAPANWRRQALIEHRHTRRRHNGRDPDAQTGRPADLPRDPRHRLHVRRVRRRRARVLRPGRRTPTSCATPTRTSAGCAGARCTAG